MRTILSTAAVVLGLASPARSDIFQWEYVDPADPSQGKRQSATLVADGAGVAAAPLANLSGLNLTMAYLSGANLTNARAYSANLTNASLSQANLSHAEFSGAWLTDADFTGATVQFASFAKKFDENFLGGFTLGTGITPAQLYSTDSFQAHDLRGIDLAWNNLDGADFVGQDLTNADFYAARLTGADFTNAKVQGANFTPVFYRYASIQTGITLAQLYSTASYQAQDLSGVQLESANLSGANFAGQNLTNANFYNARLTGTDFTGANVRGANFSHENVAGCHNNFCWSIGSGITPAQLYSTASYQEGDLRGIEFGLYFYLSNAITTNRVLANGRIAGLDLDAGRSLVIRDFNSYLIPITIDQHLTMGSGGTLRMVFETDLWDSTISFAPNIPVALGGALELTFAGDVNLASQVGRTFDLFDWTGVTPTGTFAISGPYLWDLSELYSTGEVTLVSVPEPSCAALAVVSAFSLFRYRRRRKP